MADQSNPNIPTLPVLKVISINKGAYLYLYPGRNKTGSNGKVHFVKGPKSAARLKDEGGSPLRYRVIWQDWFLNKYPILRAFNTYYQLEQASDYSVVPQESFVFEAKSGTSDTNSMSVQQFYEAGITWTVDQLLNNTPLSFALNNKFLSSHLSQKLLSLAYYVALTENYDFSQYAAFVSRTRLPTQEPFGMDDIASCLQGLCKSSLVDFWADLKNRVSERCSTGNDYWLIDTAYPHNVLETLRKRESLPFLDVKEFNNIRSRFLNKQLFTEPNSQYNYQRLLERQAERVLTVVNLRDGQAHAYTTYNSSMLSSRDLVTFLQDCTMWENRLRHKDKAISLEENANTWAQPEDHTVMTDEQIWPTAYNERPPVLFDSVQPPPRVLYPSHVGFAKSTVVINNNLEAREPRDKELLRPSSGIVPALPLTYTKKASVSEWDEYEQNVNSQISQVQTALRKDVGTLAHQESETNELSQGKADAKDLADNNHVSKPRLKSSGKPKITSAQDKPSSVDKLELSTVVEFKDARAKSEKVVVVKKAASQASKDTKVSKVAKESKVSKETNVAKDTKVVKEAKAAKETKDSLLAKAAKVTKATQEANVAQEALLAKTALATSGVKDTQVAKARGKKASAISDDKALKVALEANVEGRSKIKADTSTKGDTFVTASNVAQGASVAKAKPPKGSNISANVNDINSISTNLNTSDSSSCATSKVTKPIASSKSVADSKPVATSKSKGRTKGKARKGVALPSTLDVLRAKYHLELSESAVQSEKDTYTREYAAQASAKLSYSNEQVVKMDIQSAQAQAQVSGLSKESRDLIQPDLVKQDGLSQESVDTAKSSESAAWAKSAERAASAKSLERVKSAKSIQSNESNLVEHQLNNPSLVDSALESAITKTSVAESKRATLNARIEGTSDEVMLIKPAPHLTNASLAAKAKSESFGSTTNTSMHNLEEQAENYELETSLDVLQANSRSHKSHGVLVTDKAEHIISQFNYYQNNLQPFMLQVLPDTKLFNLCLESLAERIVSPEAYNIDLNRSLITLTLRSGQSQYQAILDYLRDPENAATASDRVDVAGGANLYGKADDFRGNKAFLSEERINRHPKISSLGSLFSDGNAQICPLTLHLCVDFRELSKLAESVDYFNNFEQADNNVEDAEYKEALSKATDRKIKQDIVDRAAGRLGVRPRYTLNEDQLALAETIEDLLMQRNHIKDPVKAEKLRKLRSSSALDSVKAEAYAETPYATEWTDEDEEELKSAIQELLRTVLPRTIVQVAITNSMHKAEDALLACNMLNTQTLLYERLSADIFMQEAKPVSQVSDLLHFDKPDAEFEGKEFLWFLALNLKFMLTMKMEKANRIKDYALVLKQGILTLDEMLYQLRTATCMRKEEGLVYPVSVNSAHLRALFSFFDLRVPTNESFSACSFSGQVPLDRS